MCNKENTMKYMILVLSISSIFFAGCSVNNVKQSDDIKPLEERTFEPAQAVPSAQLNESDVGNVRQSEEVESVEGGNLNPAPAAPSARLDENDVENIRQSEDVKAVKASNKVSFLGPSAQIKGSITTKDQRAKEAVDTALQVLGGKDKIDAIESLVIKGTHKLLPSENVLQFEYRILLPDSLFYISKGPSRIERYPEGIMYNGIVQGKIFQAAPYGGNDPAWARAPFPWNLARNWSLVLLGTLMKSGFVPFMISSGVKPGVFDLTANTGQLLVDVPCEMEFDSETGYPSFFRCTRDFVNIVEYQYRDRFLVDGVMFPRVIIENFGGGSSGERRIEEVQINPKLSLKDFEGY